MMMALGYFYTRVMTRARDLMKFRVCNLVCYTLEKVYLCRRVRKLPDDIMKNSDDVLTSNLSAELDIIRKRKQSIIYTFRLTFENDYSCYTLESILLQKKKKKTETLKVKFD